MTFAQLVAKLQAMREAAFRMVAALRSALSTRGNLVLELLALLCSAITTKDKTRYTVHAANLSTRYS